MSYKRQKARDKPRKHHHSAAPAQPAARHKKSRLEPSPSPALNNSKQQARAILKQAAQLTAAGKFQDAIAALRQSVSVYPQGVETRLTLAKALRSQAATQDELNEVEALLRAALENTGEGCDERESECGLETLQALGFHMLQEGRTQEARGVLTALGKTYRCGMMITSTKIDCVCTTCHALHCQPGAATWALCC